MSGEYFTRKVCPECNNDDRGLGALPCNHCSAGWIYTKVATPPGTERIPKKSTYLILQEAANEICAASHGHWHGTELAAFAGGLQVLAETMRAIELDLSGVEHLTSTAVGDMARFCVAMRMPPVLRHRTTQQQGEAGDA